MKQVVGTVISNKKIVMGVTRPHARSSLGSRLLWLNCPEIAREAKPGQFVMARCGRECILPRPFSIHQVKGGDIALFFTILEGGKGTGWLSQRKARDKVNLFGPLGNGFSVYPASKNLLFLAGGIGIAPLYFLAQEALKKGGSVALLYGTADKNRYPQHLLPPGIRLVEITEDGSVGKKGRVSDFLPEFIDWADQVFACGPMPMYQDMYLQREKLLKGKPTQVSLEVVMGCGRGVCYGCTIKTKGGLRQVCKDGPVFDLNDILWDELKF